MKVEMCPHLEANDDVAIISELLEAGLGLGVPTGCLYMFFGKILV